MAKVAGNDEKTEFSVIFRRILMVIALVGLLTAVVLLIIKNTSKSSNQVESLTSLIDKQESQQKAIIAKGYTVDEPNIIVDPYGISPLTALIAFETPEKTAPTVIIKGEDEPSTFSHTFNENTTHYLPVYGLYAGRDNDVQVMVGERTIDLKIKTTDLPKDMPIPSEIKAQKDKLTNELYFFTPSSKGYTVAYDVNGDVRWYLTTDATWEIGRLKNGHLLVSSERLLNPPYYTTGLYEIDLLGKIYKEYKLPGGYHHDYFELENGNLLVASDDFDSETGTVEDIVVEIDSRIGNIVKEWDLKDILNTSDGQMEDWSAYDWFHNNSVWYDKNTDSITLSGRHKDAVINIDYKTGDLNWIIGDPTNWDEKYQPYFFTPIGETEWQWAQHAAMITPEGYVFILDNGNNKSKIKAEYVPADKSYTRGVMYKIDTDGMTIEQIWQYGKERGSEFYSPYISDVDYIDEDHYIVHSGGISYKDGQILNVPAGLAKADKLVSDTVEVKGDEVIYEIKLPTNNYRVEKMSLYAPNEECKPTGAVSLGSLGETPVSSVKYGFMARTQDGQNIIEDQKIKTIKEFDRLVFSGRFKQGQKVELILAQGLEQRAYDIRVSKKPYTALCVDIFSEEETEKGIMVTKYINQEGLSGRYSLYLNLDGQLYNLDRYVEF